MKKLFFPKQVLFLILISAFVVTLQSCKKDSTLQAEKLNSTVSTEVTQAVANLDSGLICYLKFNKNLKDSSGHRNNGTAKNGTFTYVKDRFDNPRSAVAFADSRYIEIPEKDIAGLKTGTISLDFYVTAFSQSVLVSKMSWSAPIGTPQFYQSIDLGFRPDGTLSFLLKQKDYCSSTTGWNPPLLNTANTLAINTWHHIAITFNNTVQKMYINGVLIDSESKTVSPICQEEPLRLGVWWSADPEYFNGNMDEFRFYNRALSAAEVKKLSKL